MPTAARTSTRQKKARARRTPRASTLPHIDPDYPVKPMVDPETGRPFTVVSIRQPDGTFVAVVAENQQLRSQARSRQEAEAEVADLFLEKPARAKQSRAGSPALTQLIKVRTAYDPETKQFEVHIPELNGISTCAPTKPAALERAHDLIRAYIEGMEKLKRRIPMEATRLAAIRRAVGIR